MEIEEFLLFYGMVDEVGHEEWVESKQPFKKRPCRRFISSSEEDWEESKNLPKKRPRKRLMSSDEEYCAESKKPRKKRKALQYDEEKKEFISNKYSPIEEYYKESSSEDDLEDEDYDLLKENLGVNIGRKKKIFRRIRPIENDDSDKEETELEQQPYKETISKKISPRQIEEFGNIKNYSEKVNRNPEKNLPSDEFEIETLYTEPDQPPKNPIPHKENSLQTAREVFGINSNSKVLNNRKENNTMGANISGKELTKDTPKKLTIYDIYEPSDIERNYFTDLDQRIKLLDVPERFQIRDYPVRPAGNTQILNEARWIYMMAFTRPTLSQQDMTIICDEEKAKQKMLSIVDTIKFIRNQHFDIPFIAFYRKENIEPDLTIQDLWTVYKWDEKWCHFRKRKRTLRKLLKNMKKFQQHMLTLHKPLPLSSGSISQNEFQVLKDAQTFVELNDIYQHLLLHHGLYFKDMKDFVSESIEKDNLLGKENIVKRGMPEEEHSDSDESEDEINLEYNHKILPTYRKNTYVIGLENSIHNFVKLFGLSAEYLGENLKANRQRHKVVSCPIDPKKAAEEYISSRYTSVSMVQNAARYMASMQISNDPNVKKVVRQAYQKRATISLRPSEKGIKEIDENHYCFSFLYLKNKPIGDIKNEQFLHISLAQEEGLLNYQITMDTHVYLEEIKYFYFDHGSSNIVEKWNNERYQVLTIAFEKYIFPALMKEIQDKLLQESKEWVLRSCSRKLYNWIKVAPYQIEHHLDGEVYDTKNGIRVLGIAYTPQLSVPSIGALVDENGLLKSYISLPHLLRRRDSWNSSDRELKDFCLQKLRSYIDANKPHVIVVGGENRYALMLVDDIRRVIDELSETCQMPAINVELLDNDLAKIYMNSSKAEKDFKDYPPLLKQAVSLARRLQDPLIEFSQLCTIDEEILCLKYHPLQDKLSKNDLLDSLYLEFINRTNEVGVDINRAISYPHTSHLIQFICGLGPRKANYILQKLKQSRQNLSSRTQLITLLKMGPKIFINSSGFFKISHNFLRVVERDNIYVLDGSRVHPEAYDWARKMAVDAFEGKTQITAYEALNEIYKYPDKLKDLDLNAFSEELENQGYGNKRATLYDIRAELNNCYKDLRAPFRKPTGEETFSMLTKETPQTFNVGKMLLAEVVEIVRKKPLNYDQIELNNSNFQFRTGMWQCPFCLHDDFPEPSAVWHHLDSESCQGQAIGIRMRIDNGVNGYIPRHLFRDKAVDNFEKQVRKGMIIHCRIKRINFEKFNVLLTSRSSDLVDPNNEWKLSKDEYYDYQAEEEDRQMQNTEYYQTVNEFIKRVIVHPLFFNITYKQAEDMIARMDQGSCIFRPSSKAANHLILTWKVCEDIHQKIDIREEGKDKPYNIGQVLWINDERYDDLDEIIFRCVNPMAALARTVLNFKYFNTSKKTTKNKIEEILKGETIKYPFKIPYLITPLAENPGCFLLSYYLLPTCKHLYFTLTPKGFKYDNRVFPSLNNMISYFKNNFKIAPINSKTQIEKDEKKLKDTESLNFALGSMYSPMKFPKSSKSIPIDNSSRTLLKSLKPTVLNAIQELDQLKIEPSIEKENLTSLISNPHN
ncbi:SUPT6H, partial [Cordylochernes scorpioides]